MSTRNSEGDDSLFLSFVSEIKSRAKFHKKCSDGSIILNGNDIAGQKRMTQALAVEHFFAILPTCNHDLSLASRETRAYLSRENCLHLWDEVRASIQVRVSQKTGNHAATSTPVDTDDSEDNDRSH